MIIFAFILGCLISGAIFVHAGTHESQSSSAFMRGFWFALTVVSLILVGAQLAA